ncbi:hypothetical protein Agub_g1764 [Astrephomene gubernaculifera]|uniref:Protein unc-45 homolog B n=1 Tax=Astrephomene gubernaculifera TaxID=47775 RepID=A0AAD3HI20_9CHLO|nr:hypothetical protein Agub_g1764 [Astrephomene gubernaculifera]
MAIEEPEDVEDFLEKVDEVNRLIEGLKVGTISPEYIDTKLQLKQQKDQERVEVEKRRPAGRGPAPIASAPAPEAPASQSKPDEEDQDTDAERREQAMAKVKELMANRERKLRARARYEEYVQSQERTQFGTDYTKWDIWCPEDEEDDLINSIGPNTPQFKAMEKDIDERHRQMVERRQLAERCRVRGNAAYQARQYSEALRCYQEGLESERTNMALHANAAMAALKMSCFVQAIEHCDKVLSIADFFHNNKQHPLCVKALQRRAEAYRALHQPSRALRDLQEAAQMEPGNPEVAKQLERARQEDEEARKQRAIAKAVSRGAAGRGASAGEAAGAEGTGGGAAVEAAGMALDLEKLGRLERLVGALAPAESAAATTAAEPAEAAAAAAERAAAGETVSNSQQPQQPQGDAAAHRGPSLPPRQQAKGRGAPSPASGSAGAAAGARPQAADPAAAATAATCAELQLLLRGGDACCVYLRECGGLENVAKRIAKRPAGCSSAPSDLAPLLLLLNDACMNDGNLKQLPALKVLPAVVAALDGAGEEAAAAAATLLCTAVTNEEVRREVSKLLGTAEHLPRLLRLLSAAKPAVQGVALALLGNCMVDKPTKAAMGAAWRKDAAAADCFLAMLRSANPVLAEKAVVLMGNMATDATLRSEILARQGGVVRQLVALVGGGGAAAAPTATQPQRQAMDMDVRRAAATALLNLTVEEQGQRLVAEDGEAIATLYGLATAVRDCDRVLSARAAGVCARAAKVHAGAAALLRLGAVAGMLGVVSAALDSLDAGAASAGSHGGSAASGEAEAAVSAALLDAAVRTLTILTSPDDAALSAQLVAGGGVEVLLRIVRSTGILAGLSKASNLAGSGLGDSVLANAVLCVAGIARCKEHLPVLRAAEPVPPLVKVAYDGRGNTASKNAAIALARLAHDPAMLEKLRELHGIEIIYQYVKP